MDNYISRNLTFIS